MLHAIPSRAVVIGPSWARKQIILGDPSYFRQVRGRGLSTVTLFFSERVFARVVGHASGKRVCCAPPVVLRQLLRCVRLVVASVRRLQFGFPTLAYFHQPYIAAAALVRLALRCWLLFHLGLPHFVDEYFQGSLVLKRSSTISLSTLQGWYSVVSDHVAV